MSDHQLTTLPSGITVVTEPMPAVRSVTVGLWLPVGSRDEAPQQAGCSHFLEHLLFKGTERRTAQDIAETFDAVGGEMNAFTSKEVTCFHARVLDDDLPIAMDVLGDMMANARNAAVDVEAERQVVLSELDIHLDTPDDLVHTDLWGLVFGDHPLAAETLGTVESVLALDRDTIHAYFLERYRPEQLVVAAAGAVSHDRLVSLVEELLGDLGRPGGTATPRAAPSTFGAGQIGVRSRPTEQAHIALGWAGIAQQDDDRWALGVLTELLGGGMSSRLFQEIRERRGLAYTTYAFSSSFTDAGLMAAYAGTAPGKVDEVLDVLRSELDRVVEDVTESEVRRAKGALTGGTVLGLEDTAARMSRLGRQVVLGQPVLTIDEALNKLHAVDLDTVRAVARRVLSRPRNLAIVGPFSEDDADRFATAVH